ncbi:MAG: DUF4249 domain-containing protein [Prevotellaceae bacterium]|nr:DUF4249 domain-containing protein [Prevotellaceae bacterium]
MRANSFFFFFAAATLAGSCVERVTIDTNSQNSKLIVIAMLTSDTMQQVVTITRSTNFFGGDTCPSVPDAKVWINNEQLTLLDAGKGVYATEKSFFVVPGNHYRLRVLYDIDGDGVEEEFWAEDVVPRSMWALGTQVTPINMEGDTSKYAPPFIVSALIQRESTDDDHVRITHLYNGRPVSENLSQYAVFSVPYGFGNIIPAPGISRITRGDFFLDDMTDTVYCCPFDTLTIRVNSINEAMARYVLSAQREINGSNPMFGGAPANVESNIHGDNVMGCFGLCTGGKPIRIVLPMNTKTLDGDNAWFNQRDTALQIVIRDEGTATYITGHQKGQTYFAMTRVDAGIRGFWAHRAGGAGSESSFEMKSYNEFWDIAGGEKWTRGSRIR